MSIQARINAIQEKAKTLGVIVELNPDTFIDEQHLNCFWYGGRIGSVEYENWKLIIEVNGDVRLYEKNSGTTYSNKNNNGAWGQSICDFVKNDDDVQKLHDSGAFIDNNWIEWLLQAPGKPVYDPGMTLDNVLNEDNVLAAFENLENLAGLIQKCATPRMLKFMYQE